MADSYSYDMQRLQQDAIRRAREMQARAMGSSAPQRAPAPVNPVPAPPPVQQPEPARRIPPAEPKHSMPREQHIPVQEPLLGGMLKPVEDIFELLMKDSERTLILLLIFLLVEEKSNPEVIFTLMYLIL